MTRKRTPVLVGTVLYGHCGGAFGRDSFTEKRVEALGADWVVARSGDGHALVAFVSPEELEEYTIDQDLEAEDAAGEDA